MVAMLCFNFEDLKFLKKENLLSLAKRANELYEKQLCDEKSIHHITNAVSYQKYGIEDVVECTNDIFNDVKEILFQNGKVITIEE